MRLQWIFRWTRAVSRLLVLLGTSTQAGLVFVVRRLRGPLTIAERAQWLHDWCSLALRRLGIETIRDGQFPSSGLLVSNHLGYLDILVFSE
jgi:lyso-ornithine lipid O-acyltransferase